MSRSLNSYQKRKIKEAHNDTCDICRCKREKKYLQVHHIKTNKLHSNYNYSSNLMVLCNEYTETKCHNDLHETLTSGECERNKTNKIKNIIDCSDASAEIQINEIAEMHYRNWLIAIIKKRKIYPRKEAINSGAEICDISPQTARRYYNKLVSEFGPLRQYKDDFKRWQVFFKK